MATSYPKKQAALAGKALIITGATPLKRARGPSFFMMSTNTLRMPFGYFPSGAGRKVNIHVDIKHFYKVNTQ